MRYFPLFLDLHGRSVVVVGGGEVALRKVRALLEAGAMVTVVAPHVHPALADACVASRDDASKTTGSVQHVRATLPANAHGLTSASWFQDAWFVVAATDDANVNAAVAAAGEQAHKFVNVVDDAAHCSAIVPAIIDRSPLLVAVSTGGTAPMLARRVRRDVELLLDAGLGRLAQFFARWRVRVTAAVAAPARRRELYDQWMDGDVARLVRDGREDAAGEALAASLISAPLVTSAARGHVTLVGAGPGGAGLLTLAGLQALQRADVILVDRLVSAEVRALARRDALQIEVGKEGGGHSVTQEEIHRLLVHHATLGLNVVRLKGGDPFIFGRGGEELLCLRAAGIPYSVVPGITAALACAAQAGLPLTHRNVARSIRFATAHCRGSADETDWESLAAETDTLVLYMAVAQSARVQRELLVRGRSARTPVAIIENGGRPEQRVVLTALGQLTEAVREHVVRAPALLVIGEVASLAGELHWFGAVPVTHPSEATRLSASA